MSFSLPDHLLADSFPPTWAQRSWIVSLIWGKSRASRPSCCREDMLNSRSSRASMSFCESHGSAERQEGLLKMITPHAFYYLYYHKKELLNSAVILGALNDRVFISSAIKILNRFSLSL